MIRAFLLLISYGPTAGLALAQGGGAPTWEIRPTEHFEIHYQSPQRGHVDAVAREAESAYARVSLSLKHELAAKMPLILVGEDRELPRSEDEARALVTASRAGERDHLLLSVETFERRPAAALAHELTHQFVFELLPQAARDAPWVSEALPDHQGGVWDSADLGRVRDALADGGVPAIEGLTASDRHWGHAVFDFVAAEYGARGVRQYLTALGGGATPRGDAIGVAFGLSSSDFNTAFRTYVRTRFGALP